MLAWGPKPNRLQSNYQLRTCRSAPRSTQSPGFSSLPFNVSRLRSTPSGAAKCRRRSVCRHSARSNGGCLGAQRGAQQGGRSGWQGKAVENGRVCHGIAKRAAARGVVLPVRDLAHSSHIWNVPGGIIGKPSFFGAVKVIPVAQLYAERCLGMKSEISGTFFAKVVGPQNVKAVLEASSSWPAAVSCVRWSLINPLLAPLAQPFECRAGRAAP
jgi:hypothetical protein